MRSQATRVLLLGSQHGDEVLGEKLYKYIKKRYPDIANNITYMTGNPKARRQNIRYTESDLNRSYGKTGKTYEERRAARLLRAIESQSFDIVLDLHTTTCNLPPCLIVPSINPKIGAFIAATTIKHVVCMEHTFVTSSLIGHCQIAVSVEVSRDRMPLEELCQDLKRFLACEKAQTRKYAYTVSDLLKKTELTTEDAEALENFQYSKEGYYPVLVGEKAYRTYTDYLGFKAYKRSDVTL